MLSEEHYLETESLRNQLFPSPQKSQPPRGCPRREESAAEKEKREDEITTGTEPHSKLCR